VSETQSLEDGSSNLVFFISSPFAAEDVNKVLGYAGYSHKILADKLGEFLNLRHQSVYVRNDSEIKAKLLARNRTDEEYFFIYVGPPEGSWESLSCFNLILLTWEFPDFPEQEIYPLYQNWIPLLKKFDCVLIPNEMLASRLQTLQIPFLFFPFGNFLSKPNLFLKNEAYGFISGVAGHKQSGADVSIAVADEQYPIPSRMLKHVSRILQILTKTYSRLRLKKILSQRLHGFFRDQYFKLANSQNHFYDATSSGFFEFDNLSLEVYGKRVIASWLNISDDRKNFETLVMSFMYKFSNQKNLILLIKVIGDERELQKAKRAIDSLRSQFPENRAPILLLSGSHTENELLGIQKIADIYLNASSAEGICLPAIEHFLSGATLVVPSNSAFNDYFSPDEVFFFNVDTLPTHFPGDPKKILTTTWSPPVFSDLQRTLGLAVESVSESNSSRKHASNGWKKSGDDFYESLRKRLHDNH
jgi:hypothetical protein